MTYGEATVFAKEFLRGDNSGAEILQPHFKMAIMEVSTLCTPDLLKAVYDGTQTDVFRMLHTEDIEVNDEVVSTQFYIKNPPVPDTIINDENMPIDQQLSLAVVFFVCSYLSNKYTDRFEAKASKTVSVYVSNEL